MKLVTSEEMRALDQGAIKEYGIPGLILMENAALGVVKLIREFLGILKGKKITVIAGKGNNGGDGFAIARHLINNGCEVKVLILGNPEVIKGDARVNLEILNKMGNKVFPIVNPNSLNIVKVALGYSDLIVDAVFGTGFKGAIEGHGASIIELVNSFQKPVIAVDIPSGLEADTGQVLGPCIKATQTVTFALPKLGQILQPGYNYCGQLHIVDISIPENLISKYETKYSLITPVMVNGILPLRPSWGHKGTFGRVTVIGGSEGLSGAPALTSMAALRIGAGLVTLGIPESLNGLMEVKLTEVMTRPLPETKEKSLDLLALEQIRAMIKGTQALALGPGLSTHTRTKELVKGLLTDLEIPLVLDADGLNALVEEPQMLAQCKGPVVITPHPGEMARLMGIEISQVQNNRLKVALEGARAWNVIVVLKGDRTIVATPSGKVYINTTGNAGMATGGTGDILTGIICGLMAQGLTAIDAAMAGVYLHGAAGDLVVETKGILGLVAGDLLEALPTVTKKIYNY